jgi:tRNA(fMet)-specific endonuclease VapC
MIEYSYLLKIESYFDDIYARYDFDKSSSIEYATIRAELESSGNIIGSNDLLIAAHAKALEAVLVTNNSKEFERVSGLSIENGV